MTEPFPACNGIQGKGAHLVWCEAGKGRPRSFPEETVPGLKDGLETRNQQAQNGQRKLPSYDRV